MSLGKKRILVTGASGMVASEFIEKYKYVFDIMAITRNQELDIENVKVSKYVLNDFSPLEQEIIKFNPSVIVNTAFFLSSGSSRQEIGEFTDSIKFSNFLLNTAIKLEKIHWIETRSFSEFKFLKGLYPKENASYLYSVYKSFSSTLLSWYSNQNSNLKISELILFTVYGKISKSKKVIDFLIDSAESKETIIFSSGIQRLDFVHISDVISALKHSIDFQNKRIWVGTGTSTSIKELANLINLLLGQDKLNVIWDCNKDRPNDIYYANAPIDLNENWEAKIDLKKGIENYLKENCDN